MTSHLVSCGIVLSARSRMKTGVKFPHIGRVLLAAALPSQMLWPAVGCLPFELQAPMAVTGMRG